MKKNALIATVLGAVALTAGFQTVLAETAPPTFTQVVCPSTDAKSYEIDPATVGSTYHWDLTDGEDAPTTDATLSATTGGNVTVVWSTSGSFKLSSQEESEHGCWGPKTTINVTVSPAPEVDPISNNICSTNQAVSPAVDVVNLDLPQAKNGATVGKWDITSVDIPAGVTPNPGHAQVPTTSPVADATYIKNDAYENATDSPANVVYHVTPYAGDCAGDEFTITVTVYPKVAAPTIKF